MRASQEVRDLKRRSFCVPPRGGLLATVFVVSALIILSVLSQAAPITRRPSLGLPSTSFPSKPIVLPPSLQPGPQIPRDGLNRTYVGMQPPQLDLTRDL